MALLSLIQRTSSTLLMPEVKEKILNLVLGFNDHADTFSLMLHSQLVLTSMTLFEVQHLDILEHLQRYFDQLISSFSRLATVQQSTDFFAESYTKTLLKASLSVCTFFSKFLTSNQYEAIIKNVLVITDKAFTEEVKAILDVISKESTKNVGFKLIFQAMINSYDEVILSRVSGEKEEEQKVTADVSVIIIRYFNDLFKEVIQRIKKEFVIENHKKIFEFFKNSFGLPLAYSKSHGGVDMKNVQDVELAIAKSYE